MTPARVVHLQEWVRGDIQGNDNLRCQHLWQPDLPTAGCRDGCARPGAPGPAADVGRKLPGLHRFPGSYPTAGQNGTRTCKAGSGKERGMKIARTIVTRRPRESMTSSGARPVTCMPSSSTPPATITQSSLTSRRAEAALVVLPCRRAAYVPTAQRRRCPQPATSRRSGAVRNPADAQRSPTQEANKASGRLETARRLLPDANLVTVRLNHQTRRKT
jgi:hypothetical protein